MGKFFSFGNAESYSNEIMTVKEVIDINLIKMTNGKIVRLIGVVPTKATQADGTAFLNRLIVGKEVVLEYDKSWKDENGHILAFVYFNSGKNFEKINGLGYIEKFGSCISGFEAPDEMNPEPEDLIIKDAEGKSTINAEIAKKMKPKGDLYIQINLTLVGCGFADFKSMPPDTCMDSLFKIKYKEASEKRMGIWS